MDAKLSIGDLMYTLMKIKEYYISELNIECAKLIRYLKDLEKKKEKNLIIDLIQVEKDTKCFWKELILHAVQDLLQTINNRNTKGSEFVKIKQDLEKTKEDLPYDDLDIETLRSIYEETLKNYREEIKEKIEIEKFNNKRFWLGLFIGFILGLVSSLIISNFYLR